MDAKTRRLIENAEMALHRSSPYARMTDAELRLIAGDGGFDFTNLTDHELIQIIAGIASAATVAKIRLRDSPVDLSP